jgi:glutamine cyclotransferase
MSRPRLLLVGTLATTLLAASCGGGDAEANDGSTILPSFLPQGGNATASVPRVPYSPATPRLVPRVVRRWPHDTTAYTQGLLVHAGRLLESTGLRGRSSVLELELETGAVIKRADLPKDEFGEGIAVLGERIYQVTWKSKRGFVYDARTFAPIDSFTYEGEGWGMTTDGTRLYLSDGSSRIRVIDPDGFRVVRTIRVAEAQRPVHMLNELEWVNGELWANVYETAFVARIDPGTGRVVGYVDLRRLLPADEAKRLDARAGVTNGIAYDSTTGRLLVTGKYWPFLFELDSTSVRPVRVRARSRIAPRE